MTIQLSGQCHTLVGNVEDSPIGQTLPHLQQLLSRRKSIDHVLPEGRSQPLLCLGGERESVGSNEMPIQQREEPMSRRETAEPLPVQPTGEEGLPQLLRKGAVHVPTRDDAENLKLHRVAPRLRRRCGNH
jgi:hypothetical protein